jgi:hypothetical protein
MSTDCPGACLRVVGAPNGLTWAMDAMKLDRGFRGEGSRREGSIKQEQAVLASPQSFTSTCSARALDLPFMLALHLCAGAHLIIE